VFKKLHKSVKLKNAIKDSLESIQVKNSKSKNLLNNELNAIFTNKSIKSLIKSVSKEKWI
jgi:hypothetical protein